MRAALLAGILVYAILFVLTTFVPYEQAREEALVYGFTEQEIDTGLRYAFERRLIGWSATGMRFLLLLFLACTPFARMLADRLHALFGQRWFLTVLGVAVFCLLADDVLSLPFGLMRLEHQRVWGMTERPVAEWLEERLLGMGVSGLIWTGILAGLYLLIRRWPRGWWLPATGCALAGGVAYAYLQPLVIAPLFNTFTPLRETRWAALEPRLRTLVDRAGIQVSEILVIDASRQSRHTNAYFAGFGPSRRIVLYDTLLAHRPSDVGGRAAYAVGPWQPTGITQVIVLSVLALVEERRVEEIESILAHEIGHWKHNHIVKGMALAVPGLLVGFFLLSRVLLGVVGRAPLHLRTPSDPAGIPLVLLFYFVGSWIAMPLQNGISRQFERQADLTALDLAQQPDAFIAAERRLVRDNIGNVAPTPWNVWLFATHPTSVEAIRMAHEWRKKHGR